MVVKLLLEGIHGLGILVVVVGEGVLQVVRNLLLRVHLLRLAQPTVVRRLALRFLLAAHELPRILLHDLPSLLHTYLRGLTLRKSLPLNPLNTSLLSGTITAYDFTNILTCRIILVYDILVDAVYYLRVLLNVRKVHLIGCRPPFAHGLFALISDRCRIS